MVCPPLLVWASPLSDFIISTIGYGQVREPTWFPCAQCLVPPYTSVHIPQPPECTSHPLTSRWHMLTALDVLDLWGEPPVRLHMSTIGHGQVREPPGSLVPSASVSLRPYTSAPQRAEVHR
eukprot:EG_transcript_55442